MYTLIFSVQMMKLIQAQAAGKAGQRAAVEAELQQLTVKDLRMRAKAEGVDAEAIEDARDGDTPKESVTELILAKVVPHAPVGSAPPGLALPGMPQP